MPGSSVASENLQVMWSEEDIMNLTLSKFYEKLKTNPIDHLQGTQSVHGCYSIRVVVELIFANIT